MSRQTYTGCEARGGVTGCASVFLAVYMMRLAVIDDEIKDNELHLLRLVPKVWLRSDRETIIRQHANCIWTGFVAILPLTGWQDAECQLQSRVP